jgi:hypothetical protein
MLSFMELDISNIEKLMEIFFLKYFAPINSQTEDFLFLLTAVRDESQHVKWTLHWFNSTSFHIPLLKRETGHQIIYCCAIILWNKLPELNKSSSFLSRSQISIY